VIGLALKKVKGSVRAPCGGLFVPKEHGSQGVVLRFAALQACHIPALAAEPRFHDARAEVILVNTDGGPLDVDLARMIERADHFADVATAAAFLVNLDLQFPIPSLRIVLLVGMPFRSQPWSL